MTEDRDRGKRATFDPDTGEVHGSGAGAGANGDPSEDYASDAAAGGGEDAMGGPKPFAKGDQRPIDPDEGI